MAIYHLSVKVISRAAGSSALAAAAYRSASRLTDERLGRDHDFTRKTGVIHSEVLLPDGAPPEFADRERLWNAVEAGEVRKDAQLAREVEFALPREMTEDQGVALAREFVQREFVDLGMIADLNVHWDHGADGLVKPHAHVMLTMREVGEEGFGRKVRDWNRTERLQVWRERWADHVNGRLAELDIDARVDHRSFADRGMGLEPQHKIGPAGFRMEADGLASERAEDHRRIARENGEGLIRKPAVALAMITREQATFTDRDLARFASRTLASLEHQWEQGREALTGRDVLEGGLPLAELNPHGQLAGTTEELHQARRGLDAFDPHYSRDVERAYRADPGLAHEAASGSLRRAVQAMRMEEDCASPRPPAPRRSWSAGATSTPDAKPPTKPAT